MQTLLDNVDAPRLVDLNLRTPWFDLPTLQTTLEAADFLKLNRIELDVLTQTFKLPGQHPHEQAESLLDRFSLKKLLLTEGGAGAWLLNADDTQAVVVGSPIAGAANTVGAGDAFTAVFILGLLKGWPDPFMLERADEFARAVCRIRGAVPLEDDFYQHFRQDWGRP